MNLMEFGIWVWGGFLCLALIIAIVLGLRNAGNLPALEKIIKYLGPIIAALAIIWQVFLEAHQDARLRELAIAISACQAGMDPEDLDLQVQRPPECPPKPAPAQQGPAQ